MSWIDDYCRASGRKYPPLSGDDVDAYSAAEWQPTPAWARSACESNVGGLLAATDGLGSAGVSPRATLAWERLDRAYEWLVAVRARAVVKAQRQVREGIIPRRPLGLRRAQAAERRAFARFMRAARIEWSAGWPIGALNEQEKEGEGTT